MKKIIIVLTTILLVVGCKNEAKKDTKSNEATREISFNISGMTCEVGCAKTIESKLSKKEGVLEAKVVFADSTATVKFDTSKTNKKELMAFVNGIADGETYKTFERKSCSTDKKDAKKSCSTDKKQAKSCNPDCKKSCCTDKKSCSTDKKDAKKSCSTDKKQAKSCNPDCKKSCCTDKKSCSTDKKDAKKSCSTDKKQAKSCNPDCKKSCCKKA